MTNTAHPLECRTQQLLAVTSAFCPAVETKNFLSSPFCPQSLYIYSCTICQVCDTNNKCSGLIAVQTVMKQSFWHENHNSVQQHIT